MQPQCQGLLLVVCLISFSVECRENYRVLVTTFARRSPEPAYSPPLDTSASAEIMRLPSSSLVERASSFRSPWPCISSHTTPQKPAAPTPTSLCRTSPHSALPGTSFTSSSLLPNFTTLYRNNLGSSPSVLCKICWVCALASKRMRK